MFAERKRKQQEVRLIEMKMARVKEVRGRPGRVLGRYGVRTGVKGHLAVGGVLGLCGSQHVSGGYSVAWQVLFF